MGGVCLSREDKEEQFEITHIKRNICNSMSYTNISDRIKNLECCIVDCDTADISLKQKKKLNDLITACIIDAKLKPIW